MTAEFVATAEQRRLVRAMAGFGVPQADIATHLDETRRPCESTSARNWIAGLLRLT